jgi:hypothetical protein
LNTLEFRQILSGADLNNVFMNIPQSLRNRRVEMIVLPVDNADITEVPKPKRQLNLDFLAGKVPPLPDSFFDPLPEEELQAW